MIEEYRNDEPESTLPKKHARSCS
ncbi:hypothetical protein DSM3645_02608 [Blastopirellula marina DSM 3645]|uniref:Uncharacterized protein n=1 Tax=Blastopirellula marina DSM 3645 TaxID=314230 RepID=A3ZVI5_9BACT|nr:hypothetical protein DSM3645_02608 [Blastopirellula marina DSM 3645]